MLISLMEKLKNLLFTVKIDIYEYYYKINRTYYS